MVYNNSVADLDNILKTILDPEVNALVEKIASSDNLIRLPSSHDVDLPPQDVARLIAHTSNQYAEACRLAGIARARFKLAEGRYKLKFRTALSTTGRNSAEREAKALEFARDEYETMILLESVVELVESIENSARIASESARRMLLGADQMQQAFSRAGRYSDY